MLDFLLTRLMIPSLNAAALFASNLISFCPPTKDKIIFGGSRPQLLVIKSPIFSNVSFLEASSGSANRAKCFLGGSMVVVLDV